MRMFMMQKDIGIRDLRKIQELYVRNNLTSGRSQTNSIEGS
jgi:hypothetical protein